MKAASTLALFLLLTTSPLLHAQNQQPPQDLDEIAADLRKQLEESKKQLSELMKRIEKDKVPLTKELGALEAELVKVRAEHAAKGRELSSQTLGLSKLQGKIDERKKETGYLSTLLNDYVREFSGRIHITEMRRYEAPLKTAQLAAENTNLSESEVFEAQAGLLDASMDRLHDLVGGSRFEGQAVNDDGDFKDGTILLVGPAAVFLSNDGKDVGTAEWRINSNEPAAMAFSETQDADAVSTLLTTGEGFFPLDATLGNAHKVAATEETLWEHVQKGGVVMIPIFAMAAVALLFALYKWISLSALRMPSKKRMEELLAAVGNDDHDGATEAAARIPGPVGDMLQAGVEHIDEPKELIEEVMYERVMGVRMRLQRLLPFIAICAASAPLLGLLGTVTGIINTFKMITLFGSGDVKSLSGGISEALITTKFGLIVAIPSLLLHAFLSRKVRGVIGKMERAAVQLVNCVSKTQPPRGLAEEKETIRSQVQEALVELLGPLMTTSQPSDVRAIRDDDPEPHRRGLRQVHA